MKEPICHEGGTALATENPREVGTKAELSPVLARLIEEVRYEQAEGPHAYNRMHNRHNRSR